MPRGAAISFGKISVAGDGESLDKVLEILGRVIKEHGYPEQEKKEQEEKERREIELDEMRLMEMMKSGDTP